MKKFIVTLATVALVFALPSCKKCTTCKYTYPDGNGGTETFTYGEICGKKTARDAAETSCQLGASSAGGTCVCDKS